MKRNIRDSLNSLQLSDIYSLMFFILYKVQDVAEYATLSELCYLLDGNNILRLINYFAGKTITIPTENELTILVNALLLYQYVNIDGLGLADAHEKLNNLTAKQHDKVTELYVKMIPIITEYNIDRSQVKKGARV